uniref:Uncharacterized protein n=1 Tax=Neolamprologus brichardi TaxID=32507 RepID=A0A3Q4HAM2_NEOBR
MAHSARRDSPELPDFSILKRLARDQLIYLLEQVGTLFPLSLYVPVVSVISLQEFAGVTFVSLYLDTLML